MAQPVIVNSPKDGNASDSGWGFFLGVVVLIIFVIVLIVYLVPYIRNTVQSGNPQINVPDKFNININKK